MNQRGFTLIEILVSAAVSGMVIAVVIPIVFQLTVGSVRVTEKGSVIVSLDQAAHWLNRDLVQAQTTDLVDGADPVSQMTLTWTDLTIWANEEEEDYSHSITYALSGTQLMRTYDGGQQTIAGRNIAKVEFSLVGRSITVLFESSQDSQPPISLTRTYLTSLRTAEEW